MGPGNTTSQQRATPDGKNRNRVTPADDWRAYERAKAVISRRHGHDPALYLAEVRRWLAERGM
jgi:hypothetical protein